MPKMKGKNRTKDTKQPPKYVKNYFFYTTVLKIVI